MFQRNMEFKPEHVARLCIPLGNKKTPLPNEIYDSGGFISVYILGCFGCRTPQLDPVQKSKPLVQSAVTSQ